MQPLLSDDVAVAVADSTLDTPANGIRDVAGPEAAPLADFVGRLLCKHGDTSRIVARADAPYFGAPLERRSLVPDEGARIMPTRFDDWLNRAAQDAAVAAGGGLPRLFGRTLCNGMGLDRRLGTHLLAGQLRPRPVGSLLVGMAGGRWRLACFCRVGCRAGIPGKCRRRQGEEGGRRTEEDRLP